MSVVLSAYDTTGRNPDLGSPFHFKVSYQGEVEFQIKLGQGWKLLRYRYYRSTWAYHGQRPHWNYPNKMAFEQQCNGNINLLTYGTEPVSAEVLEAFRHWHFPDARTGFYDHFTNTWIECEPTDERLSHQSFEKTRIRSGWDSPRFPESPFHPLLAHLFDVPEELQQAA